MCKYCKHPEAQPLSPTEVEEFKSDGYTELLVELDGKTYNDEDLYHCENSKDCGFKTKDYHDLEDGYCEECIEAGKEYQQYVDDVRWEWATSRL